MTEKSIIPISFADQRLKTFIKEIINTNYTNEKFIFQSTSEKDIKAITSNILVTDDSYFFENSKFVNNFQKVLLINTSNRNLKIDNLDQDVTVLDIPIKFADISKIVQVGLEQIHSKSLRKLRFKKFTYDPQLRTLYANKLSIRFTEKESQILVCLIENHNTYLSKKNLLNMVWSYNESIDTHTLETHIYSLRKKIEKKLSLSNLVIFEEKKGYFLNIDIL